MVKIQMPRRRSPSRTRSRRSLRRSPRRSARRSPRRSPSRRSPMRRTRRTYRSTVQIRPRGSYQPIPGTLTDHIQDLTITIDFDILPDGLNENDKVRIDGFEGLWRVTHIPPPPGTAIVFSKVQADVESMVDMLGGLLTEGNVAPPPPPAPPHQAAVGTAPVFYSPIAEGSSVQISSSPTHVSRPFSIHDDDVELELEIAASGSPSGSTRILPSSIGDIVQRVASPSRQDAPRPQRRTLVRRSGLEDSRRGDRRERSPARSPERSPYSE